MPSKPYSDGGERLKWPTWAYNWDVVSKPPTDLQNAYMRYTNEFDNLLPEQVVWEVYGPRDNFGCEEFRLNPQCDAERNLWYMECPMICMWVVEHYIPQRVMRQFGLYQATPPDYQDTDEALHRLDRLKSKKTDWGKIHQKHVARFLLCVREAKKSKRMAAKPHCEDAFSEYLHWFLENTRVKLLPDAYPEDILEEPLPAWDELRNLEYNQDVREGRQTSFAPVMNFVRTEVQKQADELEGALEFPRDEEGNNKLRDFVRKQAQKLRRFANLLGCRDPESVLHV
uniref:Uncharacterized protein n=1 Tax=Avena sativa TaxID=4498 RepID=A0ACD6AK62_AVESA